jgi:hypothetical protein
MHGQADSLITVNQYKITEVVENARIPTKFDNACWSYHC